MRYPFNVVMNDREDDHHKEKNNGNKIEEMSIMNIRKNKWRNITRMEAIYRDTHTNTHLSMSYIFYFL